MSKRYVITPRDRWDDTTPHYLTIYTVKNITDPGYCLVTYAQWEPYVERKVEYKQAFEYDATRPGTIQGFYLATNVKILGGFKMYGSFVMHHDYHITYTDFAIAFAPPSYFDVYMTPPLYTVIDFFITESEETIYSKYWVRRKSVRSIYGRFFFTSPPSFVFYPADPQVCYRNITALRDKDVNILFGYGDHFRGDYNQIAAVREDSVFILFHATENPHVEIIDEMSEISYKVYLAKWDGRTRLWIKNKDSGFIMSVPDTSRLRDLISVDNIDKGTNKITIKYVKELDAYEIYINGNPRYTI